MALCVNISPLRFSMTRTEKYRQYREEISNMKFETFSQKREASETIEKLHDTRSGKKLNYSQVMEANEIFEQGEVKFKRRRQINLTKYEIFYYLIAATVFVALVVGLIVSGVILWGK